MRVLRRDAQKIVQRAGGGGRRRGGHAELCAGALASVLAHGLATSFADPLTGRAILWTTLAVAGSLAVIADGAAVVVAGAHCPSRHVFCRRSLLSAGALLLAVTAMVGAPIVLFDALDGAGRVTARTIAGAGSLGGALGAAICAVIALVEARRAHAEEDRWDAQMTT